MKKRYVKPLIWILALIGIAPFAWSAIVPRIVLPPDPELAIGAAMPLPDRLLDGVDGRKTSTRSVKGENGTVVVFWCNTCPWVARYEARMIAIAQEYKAKGFGFIAINANDPVAYPDEAMDKMKTRAADKKYPFPYVADAGSLTAKAYGAVRTPHVYVFNKEQKLVYVGGIDDNPQDEKAAKPYLKNALNALLNGQPVSENKTRAFGCTIKWQSEG